MRKFTSITPSNIGELPAGLGLLTAPVEILPPLPNPQPVPAWPRETPPAPDAPLLPERVGAVTGAVVDGDGRLRHFIVRLDRGARRVLVPVSAAEIDDLPADGPVVRLAWTRTQLAAQPPLSDTGALPLDTHKTTPVPPGGGYSRPFGLREAAAGGGVSAVAGAIIGTLAGGPLLGATLAVFFGVGGAVAGGISGGAREPAADALYGIDDRLVPESSHVRELERRLRDRELYDRGVLRATPMTVRATVAAEQRARSAAPPR